MAAAKTEKEPSDEDIRLIRSVLYDSLLGYNPLVKANVQEALVKLLEHVGRPKLAKMTKLL